MRTQMFFNNPVVECSGWCLAKRAPLVLWKGRRPMFRSLSLAYVILQTYKYIEHYTVHTLHATKIRIAAKRQADRDG